MRRGYSQDIRAEAITGRYRGKEWKEIQAGISEKFAVKPSIRQMQKWFEDYQGTTDDPVKFIAKAVEESANLAKPLAQARMMSDVIPLWYQLRAQYGLSAEEAGLVAMWSFYEAQLGREKLDHTYSLYLEYRDKLSQQPSPPSQSPRQPSPITYYEHRDDDSYWRRVGSDGEWRQVSKEEYGRLTEERRQQ